jgi:predicted MPP superfamily phosphohydrolase
MEPQSGLLQVTGEHSTTHNTELINIWIMRLIFIIILLLVFDWYAFQAVRSIVQAWPAVVKSIIYSIYWLIPIALIAWIMANSWDMTGQFSKSAHTIIRTVFFIVYVSKLLVVAVLFIDDIRRLAVFAYQQFGGSQSSGFIPSRSRFMAQLGLILGGIPFVSLLQGMIRNPYRYKIFQHTVNIPDLPSELEGLRIVQISDIHSGSFLLKEPVKNAVSLINSVEADLVFFTGDLVNSKAKEAEPFIDVFDKINARYGVYSVLGNHDYGDYAQWPDQQAKLNNMVELEDTHRKMGWKLLRNEHELIEMNGAKVAIIGVENYSTHPRFPKYGDLEKAHQGTEGAQLKLLLSHDPSHWEDQVTQTYKDIALTFSGHTHGFQFGIEIPGWFKWSPIKYVYKQWAGLYEQNKQYLYVNRGLGYLGYPGRVGIMPEITVLNLAKG